MKLGEGGEAFFVFETSDTIPESLQTSPIISPMTSPPSLASHTVGSASLQEPEFLDIGTDTANRRPSASIWQQDRGFVPRLNQTAHSDLGMRYTYVLCDH